MTAHQLKNQLIELPISAWVYELSEAGAGQKGRPSKRSLKKAYLAGRRKR